MRRIVLSVGLLISVLLSTLSFADAVVKRSGSDICHDQSSPYYSRIKHYQRFDSLAACINSGGVERGNKAIDNARLVTVQEASYRRSDWPHWDDVNGDCRDTRSEILVRDSRIAVRFKPNQCSVLTGDWLDPYTGRVFEESSDIDIDHIVPLAHAHEYGASHWTTAEKREFANDPDNLLAVQDRANQQKSAKAPHQWMPENSDYHCQYLQIWQRVKNKYNLTSSEPETEFVTNRLKACVESRQLELAE